MSITNIHFDRWALDFHKTVEIYRKWNIYDKINGIGQIYYTLDYYSCINGRLKLYPGARCNILGIEQFHIWPDRIGIRHEKATSEPDSDYLWITILKNNKENIDFIKKLAKQLPCKRV